MRKRPFTVIDLKESVAEGEKDRNFVMALARGLEILRAFQPSDGLLSNQEIAARTGIPKPTVSRLTYTLTRLGYLSYSERLERYQLGTGVLALGYSNLASTGIRQVARPLMQEMADETGFSVSLGSRDRLSMVYLENCQGGGALTLRMQVGSKVPIATSAMGRAFLAILPEEEREYLMDHIRKKDEESWPQVEAGIRRAIEEYQQKGYCTSAGDWEREVNAVGVPLVLSDGSDVVAFNCGGPAFRLRRDMLDNYLGRRLVELVETVRSGLSTYR